THMLHTALYPLSLHDALPICTHSTKFLVRGWQMELVRSDQVEAAANTLAEAFWDDPLMQIVAPNEKKRTIVAPWFFAKSIAYGLRWGEVSSNDDASAVAIWFP